MHYFIIRNNEKIGPVTKAELIGEKSDGQDVVYVINRDTLIWREGLSDWTKAEDIEEIKPLFKSVPPSLPKNIQQKQEFSRTFASFAYILLIGASSWLLTLMICNIIFETNKFDSSKYRNWKPSNQNSNYVETPYWLVDGFGKYTDGRRFWNPDNPSRSYEMRKDYLEKKSMKISIGAAVLATLLSGLYFFSINSTKKLEGGDGSN